jgi:hypothetical protein
MQRAIQKIVSPGCHPPPPHVHPSRNPEAAAAMVQMAHVQLRLILVADLGTICVMLVILSLRTLLL